MGEGGGETLHGERQFPSGGEKPWSLVGWGGSRGCLCTEQRVWGVFRVLTPADKKIGGIQSSF